MPSVDLRHSHFCTWIDLDRLALPIVAWRPVVRIWALTSDLRGLTCRLDFHWKLGFAEDCLVPLLDLSVSVSVPEYTDVLKLDHKIREFHVPPHLKADLDQTDYLGEGAPSHVLSFQRALTLHTTDVALLQLHRIYFRRALLDVMKNGGTSEPSFTMEHEFAPSVLATFRSARRIAHTLTTLYRVQPGLTSRYSVLWFHGFCAAVSKYSTDTSTATKQFP